jgi:hypothetical protein
MVPGLGGWVGGRQAGMLVQLRFPRWSAVAVDIGE